MYYFTNTSQENCAEPINVDICSVKLLGIRKLPVKQLSLDYGI